MPHSRIQFELGFILHAGTCQILNCAQNPRQSQSVQGTELNWVGGGHCTEKVYTGRGGPRTYFVDGGKIGVGVGTPHIFSEQGANRKGGTLHILSEQGANRVEDTAHQNRLPVVIGSVRKRLAAGGWVVS